MMELRKVIMGSSYCVFEVRGLAFLFEFLSGILIVN